MKSEPRRIVVVGGVAAGASAATKARRTDEGADIVIFERGQYVSFANCGLPYYVSGDIRKLDDLLLMTPERFAERFRIRVELRHEVTRIDRESRRVEVLDLDSGRVRLEPYDRLILAPGGRPVLPPIPGAQLPGISALTTVPHADYLRRVFAAASVHVQAEPVCQPRPGARFVAPISRAATSMTVVGMMPHIEMSSACTTS